LDEQSKKIDEQAKQMKVLADRAHSIIDEATHSRISASVLALSLTNKFNPCGVCFLISPSLAVTCKHNIVNPEIGLETLVGATLYAKNESKTKYSLNVSYIDDNHDYAFLSLKNNKTVDNHLTLLGDAPRAGVQFLVASYQIGIMEDLDEFNLSVGISSASLIKVTTNHFLYQSTTYSGDSGGALTLIGGNVIGMHLSGVNEARERKRHNEGDRQTRAEKSIDDLIAGTGQGCIGILARVLLNGSDKLKE
jgi:V8-like Glu-specific endopeptidase